MSDEVQVSSIQKLGIARQLLAEAKNLDDVLHIRDIAEAARVYAQAAKLGLENQNEAAEVKIRAERKAGEMLAQMPKQDGGDARRNSLGNNVLPSNIPPTLSDLGIEKMQSHRWQTMASLPEETFDELVSEVKAENKELTSSLVYQTAKGAPHVANNSGNNEWYTPLEYIQAARAVMGEIDLDPASSEIANRTVGASVFYSENDNGLIRNWAGRVWMNPPYASDKIGRFCDKLAGHFIDGDVSEAIVLVNNATETGWFNQLIDISSAVVFSRGRVKFLDQDGNPGAPLQGQAILYLGDNPELFLSEFTGFGWGAKTWKRMIFAEK